MEKSCEYVFVVTAVKKKRKASTKVQPTTEKEEPMDKPLDSDPRDRFNTQRPRASLTPSTLLRHRRPAHA